MKKLVLMFSSGIALVVSIGLTSLIKVESQSLQMVSVGQETVNQVVFDSNLFFPAVAKINNQKQFTHLIIGGVIPHHLLASELIADFFSQLRQQNPKTIILIGPNHEEKGDYPILTSCETWATAFKNVSVDSKLCAQLVNSNMVDTNNQIIAEEYSISGIVPFIAYYLPETQVVPLVISNKLDVNVVVQISDLLTPLLSQDTVLIASVDFSHYLSQEDADKKDSETEYSVRNFKVKNILTMGNDYLDAPMAMAIWLESIKDAGITQLTFLAHANSADFLKQPPLQTTSYFVISADFLN